MNLVMKLSISIWQLKYALSWGEGHGINNIILNKSFTVIIDLLLVFKEIYIYIYITIIFLYLKFLYLKFAVEIGGKSLCFLDLKLTIDDKTDKTVSQPIAIFI